MSTTKKMYEKMLNLDFAKLFLKHTYFVLSLYISTYFANFFLIAHVRTTGYQSKFLVCVNVPGNKLDSDGFLP